MNTITKNTNVTDLSRVTIVIVNWNTVDVTCECLRSLVESEIFQALHIVVVDNGSSDDSVNRIAEEFRTVQLICNAHNKGFAAANNQVLKNIDTDYVLLLNSDTLVRHGVVSASVDFMDKNRDVGIMGCRVLNPDGTPQLTCGQYPHLRYLTGLTLGIYKDSMPRSLDAYRIRNWNRDSERCVETVTGCYMMVRSEALEEVGLMDEGFFFYGEETDWCRRFKLAGWELKFAPVGEIVHFGSLSARKLSSQRDILLTAGLVRLHLKYGGPVKALLAWLVLSIFNCSRAAYWLLRHFFKDSAYTHDKAKHFVGVCTGLSQVWNLASVRSKI
jgi:GT2 family glycosyltransferase